MRTKLSQFKFELPEELIAKYPSEQRDESRLMVVHRETGKIEHKIFKDVLDYFDDEDCMKQLIENVTRRFTQKKWAP